MATIFYSVLIIGNTDNHYVGASLDIMYINVLGTKIIKLQF